jgi:hypothetical protein
VRINLISVVIATLIAVPTQSAADPGAFFLSGCGDYLKGRNVSNPSIEKTIGAAICSGYVRGFMGGINWAHTIPKGPWLCLPDGMPVEQGVRAILKFVQENPEERQKAAGDLGALAYFGLLDAFPCADKLVPKESER